MSISWINRSTNETAKVPPGFVVTGRLSHPAQLMAAYHELGQYLEDLEPNVTVSVSVLDEQDQAVSYTTPIYAYRNLAGAESVAEAVIRCQQSAYAQAATRHQRFAVLVRPNVAL